MLLKSGMVLPNLQIVMFFNEIGCILSGQLWLVESDDIWKDLAKASNSHVFFNEIGWILSRQLWLVESDDIWRNFAKA